MDLPSITPGPAALKALSHPVRLRILEALRVDGPSTATALAARLGLNSGATSYHLRQLAQHGFVVDDPERGTGRDRWWKAAHQSTRTTPEGPGTSPEERQAHDAFGQALATWQTEYLQAAVQEMPHLPAEWRRASTLSDWGLVLTADRAAELVEAIGRVIEGWDEADPATEGAEQFMVVLNAFPRPGRTRPAVEEDR